MIIGVLGQKAGTGKSTLAVNLAHKAVLKGKKTLLLDTDNQGSVSAWASVRDEPLFPVLRHTRPNLHKEIDSISAGYDVVFVDGSPHDTDSQRGALLACSHVLIPLSPSGSDLWSTVDFCAIAKRADALLENQKRGIIMTKVIKNTAIAKNFPEQVREVLPFPLLNSITSQRVGYMDTFSNGLTVYEAKQKACIEEIDAIFKEFVK